ncbi:MAG: hypothetical protein VX747_04645, partial [Actinomycetota bacterium]|nr:hypothetical protein [Actinomycetota bacterium]
MCEAAGTTASGCTYTTPTPADQLTCGAADRNSVWEMDLGTAYERVSANYLGCFNDGSTSRNFELKGDAFVDSESAYSEASPSGFGLTFDGEGDYAELTRTEDYANDGTFAIALWFTKTPCTDPDGPYQVLYSHRSDEPTFRDPYLQIMVGCSHQGAQSTASDGDIIRVMWAGDQLASGRPQRAMFDVPMKSAASGGFVSGTWVHFVLNVGRSGVTIYVDGVDVSDQLGHPQPNRWVPWAQTERNIAGPDPRYFGRFTGRDLKGPHYNMDVRRAAWGDYIAVPGVVKTWAEAEQYCNDMGTNLAAIHNDRAQAAA